MPNSILPSPIKKNASFVAGSPLPFYYQFISSTIREIYFSKISLIYHSGSQAKNTHYASRIKSIRRTIGYS